MKKTITSLTAQLVTFNTTLSFAEVIARLDMELNKADASTVGPLHQRMSTATSKQDLLNVFNEALAGGDFAYFFETNHHIWLNTFHSHQAPSTPPGVVYTLGNPLFAESIMRHDIRAGFNIPPRVMVVHNPGEAEGSSSMGGTTVFYHLPSSLVISDNVEVRKALEVVDKKLEEMIGRVTSDGVIET